MKINKRFKSFLYIYALFFVLCFSVITLAKYTGVISGSGTAPVAKWDVRVSGEEATTDSIIIGNTSKDYVLSVTSLSEVKVDYSILISDIPSDLVVKVDNEIKTHTNGSIVIDGVFNANDTNSTHQYNLNFSVPINSDVINNETLKIDVTFTQAS